MDSVIRFISSVLIIALLLLISDKLGINPLNQKKMSVKKQLLFILILALPYILFFVIMMIHFELSF